MFAKIFALFALFAVALAAPKPAPAPQHFTTGLDAYAYPGAPVVSAYSGAPVISPYAAPGYYPGYTGAVFVR